MDMQKDVWQVDLSGHLEEVWVDGPGARNSDVPLLSLEQIPDDIFLVGHDVRSDVPEHGHGFFGLCYAQRDHFVNVIDGEKLFIAEGTL